MILIKVGTRAISAFGLPSAASSTIRARFARPDGTLGSRASSASRSRSPGRRTSAGARDMLNCPANHTVKQLQHATLEPATRRSITREALAYSAQHFGFLDATEDRL